MALDPRIALQAQGIQLANPLEMASQAMSMREMATRARLQEQKIAEDQAVKDAFRSGIGEDGTVDRKMTMAALAKASPLKAMEVQKEWAAQDAAAQKAQREKVIGDIDMTYRLARSANDQPSLDFALSEAQRYGLDISQVPRDYTKARPVLDMLIARATPVLERLQAQKTQADIERTKAETAKTKSETAGPGGAVKMTEAQSKAVGFGRRAMLADQMINRITSDPSADVSSLKTQIKSALPKWLGGVKDQREQSLATAKVSFIASVLRKESGAAVTPHEYEQYSAIYFPAPGDSPETLQEKAVMRQNFIDTEKLTAGNAWRDPIPLPEQKKKAAAPMPAAKSQSLSLTLDNVNALPDADLDALYKQMGGT